MKETLTGEGLMRVRLAAMVLAVVLGVAAVGCQPDPDPGPSVSSAASTTAVASASPTPAPTASPTETPTASEEALFAEAKQVFLDYQQAELAVYAAGGAETMPPSVAPYVMGDWTIGLEAQYADARADGLEVRNTERVTYPQIQQAPNASGSQVAVHACVDKTKMELRTSGSEWRRGLLYNGTWYLNRDSDGYLKIFDYRAGGEGC